MTSPIDVLSVTFLGGEGMGGEKVVAEEKEVCVGRVWSDWKQVSFTGGVSEGAGKASVQPLHLLVVQLQSLT